MTPLEFLAVVLPSPDTGYYCAAGFTDRKKRHAFKQELAELQPIVDEWHAEGLDCYMAMAVFDEPGSREATHATHMRSLFIDMDGYETKKDAAQALNDFMVKTGLDLLGTPYIVSSGGGIHVYWPFHENVETARWKPVAMALKRLCDQEKMRIDMSVTADAARVLRWPGTTNFKKKYATPRPVRILAEGDVFDFDELAAHITSLLPASPLPTSVSLPSSNVIQLPGVKPTNVTASTVKLFENSVTRYKTILRKTKEGLGCGQIEHYINNAQEDGMEPLWRANLSIAQKCEDGAKAVVWLSQLHPYDTDRMNEKLSAIKGPYACVKFDEINPGICGACPHFGKITNPLALGREVAVTTEATELVVEGSNDEPAKLYKRPEAPRGYAYGQRGGVFMEKDDVDAQGNVTKRQVMLLPYDLFPVDILNTNGEHSVHLMAVRPTHTQELTIPQKAFAAKDDTIKNLASQNIMSAFGSGNDKHLYEYLRASVEKLSTEKSPTVVPSSYGWQDDDSYVFAGAIYRAGQEPVQVPMQGLENIVMNTQPTGTLENWRKIIQMLIRRKMWDHLAIMLLGAGAPLMRFTGLFGLTVHIASNESGTGKSLALDTAASVWGHPIHYRTGSGTSAVAMQQRLGLLRNNPLITDEITTNNRVDFEWFPAFLFSMSEGRGKERMESGSNKERLNLSTWASIALMSSNRPAIDYLTSVRQHSSEGELRRLLEYMMDEKLEWDADEIEVIKSLQSNYAVAGDVLVRYMVNNLDFLKTLMPQTVKQMYKEYAAPNDERYWMGGVACGVAAGVLFNSQHAGLADIPMQEIVESYRRAINNMRVAIRGGKRTADDVLNAYIQEYQGSLVVVKFGEKAGALAHFYDGAIIGKHTTRKEVMGRVEHGVAAGAIDFYIEERLMKAFCSNMSFSYANFKRQMEQLHTVSYMPRKDMLAKTEGPPMRVAVMRITRHETNADEELINPVSVASN